jgi:hypothetical protein
MPATTAGACDASGEMGLFASTRVSDDVKRTINTDIRDHATKRRYGQQQQLAAT